MKLRQSQAVGLKTRLSTTMRDWLPILQAGIEELEDELKRFEARNPYIRIESGYESRMADVRPAAAPRRDDEGIDWMERLAIESSSLYRTLFDQIAPPLFPTPKSEAIARSIVESLDEEGYFAGDIEAIAAAHGCDVQTVERVRRRFAHLDPPGVGAVDLAESMKFQLIQSETPEPLYSFVWQMLERFGDFSEFKQHPLYADGLRVIRSFKTPPAIEFFPDSRPVVPDLLIMKSGETIVVRLNDAFYPKIEIDAPTYDDAFVKKRLRSPQPRRYVENAQSDAL